MLNTGRKISTSILHYARLKPADTVCRSQCIPCCSRRAQKSIGLRYSTSDSNSTSAKPNSSIFSKEEDTWDHVFKDIHNMPPLTPSALRTPVVPNQRRGRRQQMSASELRAFDEMFSMIFDAVSNQKSSETRSDSSSDDTSSVDANGRGLSELYGKLRKHSKRMRWTTEAEELLDRKKEAMDMCDTDQELLDWAIREVFNESASATASEPAGDSTPTADSHRMLRSPAYPHLIAQLMRTFRDKYHDPNLALSIFDHARNLSIPSYVFGCTTMAYNELIETKWSFFRDLKGVHDALQEMAVNGVDIDTGTRKIVDLVRREAGKRNLWIEDEYVGEGELWDVLKSIEEIVKAPVSGPSSDKSPRQPKKWDEWKTSEEDDGWEFDRWDETRSSRH